MKRSGINHVHGIMVTAPTGEDATTNPRGYDMRAAPPDPDVATHGRASLQDDQSQLYRRPRSLGSFIAGYKSVVTKRINQFRHTPGAPVWQRRYHDHIIRNERSWHRIRRYIETNPSRWTDDTYHQP